MSTILLEHEVEVPNIGDLADFRRWALSEDFPQRGRIDYIGGRIEVDMSPEDLFTHGTLKSELSREITQRVTELDLGHSFCAETRISSVAGDVSAEPDVVVITYQAVDDGRVSFVSKASREEGRFVEVAGAPDLIVEIVSDSSVAKDTQRLPAAYFAAGVREFWLVDARGDELVFVVQRPGTAGFEAVELDAEGFQPSDVLRSAYRLERERHRRGHWVYRLARN